MNEQTLESSEIETMSEQIKELFKKAEEAYEKNQQIKSDHKFFAWLEKTFGIKKYERTTSGENAVAFVDNFMMFVCANLEEMSAEVYAECPDCEEQGFYSIGIVKSLEDLGEKLSYIGCSIRDLFPSPKNDVSSSVKEIEAIN